MVMDGDGLIGQELREEDLLREAEELLEASKWDRWEMIQDHSVCPYVNTS